MLWYCSETNSFPFIELTSECLPFEAYCPHIRIFSSLLLDSEGWSLADGVSPPNLQPLLRPGSMTEMIILLIIKSELCSWRNFHPDAGVSLWIVITIKSSCSYLLLFAYVQKPQLFSQTKTFCQNTAQDLQSCSENSPFVASYGKETAKNMQPPWFLSQWSHTFYWQSTFLPFFPPSHYPFPFSWNRPWESILCQALDRQRTKSNGLKRAPISGSRVHSKNNIVLRNRTVEKWIYLSLPRVSSLSLLFSCLYYHTLYSELEFVFFQSPLHSSLYSRS